MDNIIDILVSSSLIIGFIGYIAGKINKIAKEANKSTNHAVNSGSNLQVVNGVNIHHAKGEVKQIESTKTDEERTVEEAIYDSQEEIATVVKETPYSIKQTQAQKKNYTQNTSSKKDNNNFGLSFAKDDVLKGVIMAEILGKPKSLSK
ncbi:hypothetical protein PV797_13520 [Clostridiaceae bacterium M8S5]|nr:hypothetical protein PV797_13520 [Clostridiaceae bacterium M8S5]